MKMTVEYFNTHADYIVEMEDALCGHRTRNKVKKCDIDSFIEEKRNIGYGLSDIDIACPQSDSKVKYFLNLMHHNFTKNPNFKGYSWSEILNLGLKSGVEC